MKNQYFGDINDYQKYGLIRSIISATNLEVFIAWMLTPDDGSTDGKFIEYINQPDKWKLYDKTLYEKMAELLSSGQKRSVSLIENTNLLNNSLYYSVYTPDNASERNAWFSQLKRKAINSDIVFLDPDNGLEIKSKKYGTKNSSKFLYWHEVNSLWKSGKSLLIYQHFIREKREHFTDRRLKELGDNTTGSKLEAFSTSNVVFLLALQPKHHIFHKPIVDSVNSSWKNKIKSRSLEQPPKI